MNDRDALEARISAAILGRTLHPAVAGVMPVVDELRAEIERLRAERAQIVAALDGFQLVDGDCGQPSGTLVQHVAALRGELATTREELAKRERVATDFAVADFARSLASLVQTAYSQHPELARWLIAKADSLDAGGDAPAPLAGSSPVPEEPATPTLQVLDPERDDWCKHDEVESQCGSCKEASRSTVPRVWYEGDPEPKDHPDTTDDAGAIWQYEDDGMWVCHAKRSACDWSEFFEQTNKLTEVPTSPSLPEEEAQ